MFISITDTFLNQVGYIQDSVVHNKDGRIVGYIKGQGQYFRGSPPDGQLAFRMNLVSPQDGEIYLVYKTTPSFTRPGLYDIENVGFIKDQGTYFVYRRIGSGQGKLVGMVHDGDIATAGAAFLLL